MYCAMNMCFKREVNWCIEGRQIHNFSEKCSCGVYNVVTYEKINLENMIIKSMIFISFIANAKDRNTSLIHSWIKAQSTSHTRGRKVSRNKTKKKTLWKPHHAIIWSHNYVSDLNPLQQQTLNLSTIFSCRHHGAPRGSSQWSWRVGKPSLFRP